MNKRRYLIRLTILLSIFWLSLTQSFTPINLAAGILVVLLSVYYYSVFCHQSGIDHIYFLNPLGVIYYFFYLLFSMFKASFVLLCRIIRTPPCPATLILPTKLRGELSIAILSMSITLTPGTITVDYHEGALYVLCMYSNLPHEVLKREVLGNYEELLYHMEVGTMKETRNKPMCE
ncbi:multicomponent Na+:H+ antiporter subunit E [Geosporobacter subterraneus DSM 17957]|uniref:Multicomponent Na+:H+ antiporter subunit E n=1 Tax=Geosporobacter subterraneus DSM 17957 TaxID=1121919 RepID=A0A1M6N875_9FIRM|nr:Na+/H+ antiporter subunit E [Geosporobacter subterraneus]SHJ91928.1 multicomponent Na+:H+ antiporter subunit E [Geosporobacter subterraneus DSM 17957]